MNQIQINQSTTNKTSNIWNLLIIGMGNFPNIKENVKLFCCYISSYDFKKNSVSKTIKNIQTPFLTLIRNKLHNAYCSTRNIHFLTMGVAKTTTIVNHITIIIKNKLSQNTIISKNSIYWLMLLFLSKTKVNFNIKDVNENIIIKEYVICLIKEIDFTKWIKNFIKEIDLTKWRT